MLIKTRCQCGMNLSSRPEFAGKRAICPYCGRKVVIPEPTAASAAAPGLAKDRGVPPPIPPPRDFAPEEPLDVVEFLDPPTTPVAAPVKKAWFRPMMMALLDPRSIQWMLMLGGGLMVLGVIIWLVSLGIFENPWVIAVALGVGSLAVHAGGCYVVLRTKYKTAGRALTFLGCVVMPLNLWYYQYQGLVTLEGHLWVGAFVCCLLYAGTVYALRDPLFLYAVEGGLTLTVLLILAALGFGTLATATTLSLALLGLALVSIHAERAFPPDAEMFDRKRFGMPLFWSGHAQLAAALIFLAAAQLLDILVHPSESILGIQWHNTPLTDSWWLAGVLWLAGAYAYIYSDLVVRRVGVYTYLAAVCLIMAELSLVGVRISPELLILVIALTGVAVGAVRIFAAGKDERLSRALPPLALILSALAVALGVAVHLRATSHIIAELGWQYDAGWAFVGVMVVVAVATRLSAFLERVVNPRLSAVYFFLSAASVIVAAAGLLRNIVVPGLDLREWHQQAPILMLIPMAYLVASYLWKRNAAAWPLLGVAHASTVVILVHALFGSVNLVESAVRPVTGEMANLLLGIVFVEATIFYAVAAWMRRRSVNVYLASIAACGAVWEFAGYSNLPSDYYTLLFAAVGIVLVALSRVLGIEETAAYRENGLKLSRLEGRGLASYQSGNAILVMAFLAAFLKGLSRLVATGLPQGIELRAELGNELLPLLLTALAGGLAICLAARRNERWLHTTATIAQTGLFFIMLNVLIDLSGWQKLEIFSVAVGVLVLAASYIGRFREDKPSDAVSVGLWVGSVLAAGALFVAMCYHRLPEHQPSLVDELALLTVAILMVATGCGLQFKAPTIIGGGALTLYLAIFIAQLFYRPQWMIGFYLAIAGAILFGIGMALSIYRDRLLTLPEKFANREGLFRVIGWR